MQLSQLAISFCCNYNNNNDEFDNEKLKTSIIKITKDAKSKEELLKFLTMRSIPFLRKACILYNAFGCIKSLDDLWHQQRMNYGLNVKHM